MVQFFNGAGVLYIDEAAVQSFIRDGGAVAHELNKVAKTVRDLSREYLDAGDHNRSFRLRNGLKWARTQATGPLQGRSRASSVAKHTIFFHEGTANNGAGDIFPTGSSGFLIIPRNRRAPHTNLRYAGAGTQKLGEWSKEKAQREFFGGGNMKGKGVQRKDSVRGQRSKPFLTEGLAASMALHGFK